MRAIDQIHAQHVADRPYPYPSILNDSHIKLLAHHLGLPEWMEIKDKKGHIEGHMALAILLNWLAFPTRQDTEMPDLFNRPRRTIQA
jgi:hypothetical protein